jgi:hypothetical protein
MLFVVGYIMFVRFSYDNVPGTTLGLQDFTICDLTIYDLEGNVRRQRLAI